MVVDAHASYIGEEEQDVAIALFFVWMDGVCFNGGNCLVGSPWFAGM